MHSYSEKFDKVMTAVNANTQHPNKAQAGAVIGSIGTSLQKVDSTIQDIRLATGNKTTLFPDETALGFRANLDKGKLGENQNIVIGGLQLLAAAVVGTGAGGAITEDDVLKADYSTIDLIAGLRNGFIKITVDSKSIMERVSLEKFLDSQVQKPGYFDLTTPKALFANSRIVAEVDHPTLAAGTHLKLVAYTCETRSN